MNAVYDHIFAIVFIGVLFVWAVSVVPLLSFNNIQAANQQQLRNMELNVLNNLLLDTGIGLNGTQNTTEWGSLNPFDETQVSRLGLASTREGAFFTLDPDKVQRMVTDNPMGTISYERTKALLGLQDYNFMLQIIPPFNVTNINGTAIDAAHSPINATLLQTGVLHYEVKVLYLDGRPIPNAMVQSKVLYTQGTEFYMLEPNATMTDELGINIFSSELVVVPYSVMVVMTVSVADVASIVVTFGQQFSNIVDVSMVDDQVILTALKEPNNAASWIMGIYYYSSDGSLPHLYTGGKTQENKINTGSGQLWSKDFNGLKSLDPVVVVLDVLSVDNGRRDLIVAGPYQNLLGFTVFEYGAQYADQMAIVSTQRSVVISGMTYIAQFILWKDSL